MVAKTKGSDMGDGLAGLCFNSALVVSGGDAAQRAARQAGLRELGRCIRSIRKLRANRCLAQANCCFLTDYMYLHNMARRCVNTVTVTSVPQLTAARPRDPLKTFIHSLHLHG